MKKQILLLVSLLLIACKSFSQEKIWQVKVFSFFDNIEFGGSGVKMPQTMSGIMVAPEAGLRWDSVHRISAGVNLMHEFGSGTAIENFYPVAYYNYSKGPVRFLMGAFPRDYVTGKYPRLFFQDSVYYYRPNVEGISLEYSREEGYVNVWLDWTGRQALQVNEAFFTGLSAKYCQGIFYLRHFGYMYHFAGKKDPLIDEALHDNLLFHTSMGIDLSGKTFFERLDFNAGWVTGLERARADNTGWIKRHGMLIEAGAEYKGVGLFNTLYSGKGLMYFYSDHSTDLYWGDPAYRAGNYNRTDIYLKFFRARRVNMEFTWSLHFLESNMYHEQMLIVRVDLNNL
ncbi:MAG: hypothetical protein A2V64_12570 [Bacteroidetes bacterium RBG_13_43_22]|nr:MAG: hypothetical protein A2V64_12570 [Bacteroidetes bacterium RBG_13_43_22]